MSPEHLLTRWQGSGGVLAFLTGAGISAESGIPTFRGADGFWTVGSKHYSPMDLATRAMFRRAPEVVWSWYLSRFATCMSAEPNLAHHAIADLQATHGERIVLVTQNVDGLHQRAGSPAERTFPVHGDARFTRCSGGCGGGIQSLPTFDPSELQHGLSKRLREHLTCVRCSDWMRPQVLWFDECYDEQNYRAESALLATRRATLLIVVGTTGATTLPMTIGRECLRRSVPIIDVNIEASPFSDMAARDGFVFRAKATDAVPRIRDLLRPAASG